MPTKPTDKTFQALGRVFAVLFGAWGVGYALENQPAAAPLIYAGCAVLLAFALIPAFLGQVGSAWRGKG